jgi:hypothetical protein
VKNSCRRHGPAGPGVRKTASAEEDLTSCGSEERHLLIRKQENIATRQNLAGE